LMAATRTAALLANTASSTWSESSCVMKPRGVVCQQAASKNFVLRDWHSKGTVRL
jgi:hypothetical protein